MLPPAVPAGGRRGEQRGWPRGPLLVFFTVPAEPEAVFVS